MIIGYGTNIRVEVLASLEITAEIINNLLREINIKGQQQIININIDVYQGKPQIQGKTKPMKFH